MAKVLATLPDDDSKFGYRTAITSPSLVGLLKKAGLRPAFVSQLVNLLWEVGSVRV